MTPRHSTGIVAIVAGVVAVFTTGCGIQPDSAPREVPIEDGGELGGILSGSDAAGVGRIYLVDPDEDRLLSAVQRDPTSQNSLIEILLRGPNPDELADGYISAIPSSLKVLSTTTQGPLLKVDVSSELIGLSGPLLVQALAQIVYTSSELEGIQSVQITVEGEAKPLPKANLESTTDPLRTYDYPGLLRTAQPDYPAAPSGA